MQERMGGACGQYLFARGFESHCGYQLSPPDRVLDLCPPRAGFFLSEVRMKLFIVGQRDSAAKSDRGWEFQGVFSDDEKARAACTTRHHFVGPATLDEALPDEPVKWEGAYFPKAE